MKTIQKALVFTLCFLLALPANLLFAAPQGGKVVAGQAQIEKSGATTSINQSSNRAIVNWNTFDIGKNELVNHQMPNQNSAALHRVVGGQGASQLEGQLKSNGNIFLVNPKGVVIHNGAKIDTGGFVASTADIANEDFMQGNYAFTKAGHPGAAIINKGNISVRDQGLTALVAPAVRNEGIIGARLGKVALASTDTYKLDFHGDDLINFTVQNEMVDGLYSTTGTPLGVENTGEIKAEGGVVLLTAKQLDDVVTSVVNNSGVVDVASAEIKGGKIVFKGYGNTDVVNTGTVTASSEKGDGGSIRMATDAKVSVSGTVEAKGAEKGGFIDISGKKETKLIKAKVSTEAKEMGRIRLGGEFQGGKDLGTVNAEMKENFVERFADKAVLASTEKLEMDAESEVVAGGNGTLIAWSEGETNLAGKVSAKYLETSGKALSVLHDPVVAKGGVWLIDPAIVNIINSGSNNITSNQINAAWLGNYIDTQGDVYITASSHIQVANNITSYNNTGWLTLQAPTIELEQGVRIEGLRHVVFWASDSFAMYDFSSISASSEIEISAASKVRICKSTILESDVLGIGADEAIRVEGGAQLKGNKRIHLYTSPIDVGGGSVNMITLGTGVGAEVSLISAGEIRIEAKDVTLSGATIRGGDIWIAREINYAGPGQWSVSRSADSINFYTGVEVDANYHVIRDIRPEIVADLTGTTVEGVASANRIYLHSQYYDSDAHNGLPLIKGRVVTFDGVDKKTMVIFPAASQNNAVIQASDAIVFKNGQYTLDSFTVETKSVYWDNTAILHGTQNHNNAHIFGVEAIYHDNRQTDAWPFSYVRLWGPDGKVFVPGGSVIPPDPKDPDPNDPNWTVEERRKNEMKLIMFLTIVDKNTSYNATDFSTIENDYYNIIMAHAQNDFASGYDLGLLYMNNHTQSFMTTAQNELRKAYTDYTLTLTQSEINLVQQTGYMRAYLQLANQQYNTNWSFAELKGAYELAFANRQGSLDILARLRILNPTYSGPMDAVVSVYTQLRNDMIALVKAYNGQDYTNASDSSLKTAHDQAESEVKNFIATWLGAASVPSGTTDLINAYSRAKATRDAWLEAEAKRAEEERLAAEAKRLEEEKKKNDADGNIDTIDKSKDDTGSESNPSTDAKSDDPNSDNQTWRWVYDDIVMGIPTGGYEPSLLEMVLLEERLRVLGAYDGVTTANYSEMVKKYNTLLGASPELAGAVRQSDERVYARAAEINAEEQVEEKRLADQRKREKILDGEAFKKSLSNINKSGSDGFISSEYASIVMPYTRYADAAYGNDSIIPSNAIKLQSASYSSGFQASAYYDPDLNQIIISYAGTNEFRDIGSADAGIMIGNVTSTQWQEAFLFYNELFKNPDFNYHLDNNYAEIILTGHSLGGGLAQVVGAVTGNQTFAFNPAEVPPALIGKGPESFSLNPFIFVTDLVAWASAKYVGNIPLHPLSPGESSNIHIIRSNKDVVSYGVTKSIHLTDDIINVSNAGLHSLESLIAALENKSGLSGSAK